MVAASDSPQAVELLDNYKAAIFSKQLIELLPNVVGKDVDKQLYTKVITKINRDPMVVPISTGLLFCRAHCWPCKMMTEPVVPMEHTK